MTKETLMKMIEMYSEWIVLANNQVQSGAVAVDYCTKNIAEAIKQLKELE